MSASYVPFASRAYACRLEHDPKQPPPPCKASGRRDPTSARETGPVRAPFASFVVFVIRQRVIGPAVERAPAGDEPVDEVVHGARIEAQPRLPPAPSPKGSEFTCGSR